MKQITLEQLLEAGCHFGHQVKRWNPAMGDYIYTARDGVHIFDLAKTKAGIEDAIKFLSEVKTKQGKILFIGTKRQARDIILKAAKDLDMPYVVDRWLGGMLTNSAQMQKRIKRLVDLRAQKAAGELKKYTKKEQLLLDREIERLGKFFDGILTMGDKPDAVFVVDVRHEAVAVHEARVLGIPVVAIVDTNGNPYDVDVVIPANDDAVRSIDTVVGAIVDGLK
jgi:small subunit ribosomal protein S2